MACAAAAVILGGCGDSGETKTVTVTRTVTVPVGATDPGTERRRTFCASDAGDALQQAGGEATSAFNERDVKAMLRAQAKALRAAEDAPEGASCAVIALNTLRFNWNNGAQNFEGHDYRAEAEKVQRFQERHKLVGALPG
jgi:hypothetical protein